MVEAGRRDEYFPVYYVEPYEGNEAAVGFDLASNETRLKALNFSRRSGQITTTARITLVQETGEQFGFLIFRPVYGKYQPAGTPDGRPARLQGFALGVFRIGDLVDLSLCREMQGYLFSPAVTAEEFLAMLKEGRRLVF